MAKTQRSVCVRMFSEYFSSLAQRLYLEKLSIDGKFIPEPFSVGQDLSMDDMTLWPDLLHQDVYLKLKGLILKRN